jgi:hypothetical protein
MAGANPQDEKSKDDSQMATLQSRGACQQAEQLDQIGSWK